MKTMAATSQKVSAGYPKLKPCLGPNQCQVMHMAKNEGDRWCRKCKQNRDNHQRSRVGRMACERPMRVES